MEHFVLEFCYFMFYFLGFWVIVVYVSAVLGIENALSA